MAERKDLDWSKTGTVHGMAKWLRQKSGALCVVVIRAEDAVVAVDEGIRAADVEGMWYAGMPEAVERLAMEQAAAKAKRLMREDRGSGVRQ